eukprot:1795337-Rhodomonas_salina.3
MAAALRNGRAPERLQAVKVPRYSFTRLRVDGHQDRPGRRGTSIMDIPHRHQPPVMMLSDCPTDQFQIGMLYGVPGPP